MAVAQEPAPVLVDGGQKTVAAHPLASAGPVGDVLKGAGPDNRARRPAAVERDLRCRIRARQDAGIRAVAPDVFQFLLLAFAVVSVLLFWFVIAFIAGFAWWIVPKMRR